MFGNGAGGGGGSESAALRDDEENWKGAILGSGMYNRSGVGSRNVRTAVESVSVGNVRYASGG